MSGVADLAPYAANGQRLALTPIRFGPGPGGSTALSTVAQLDGPFPNGRVQALRLPIDGPDRPRRQLRLRHVAARWSASITCQIERAPARPDAPADLPDRAGDRLQAAGRPGARRARGFSGPVLNGRLGSSPLHLAAAGGQIVGKQFRLQPARHAARQAELADRVRRRAPDRQLCRRRHQRQFQRRQGDDRQCPAAAQRRRRALGCSATATSASTAR